MDETDSSQLILLFALAGIGMTLLAGAVVLFVVLYQKRTLKMQHEKQQVEAAYQRELLEVAVRSAESEQARIARDLHDSIGAMLSATKLKVAMIERQKEKADMSETASDANRMLDETITSIRRIAHDLLPPTLEKHGLIKALEQFCTSLSETSDLEARVEHADIPRLPVERELTLFRVAQELMNNTLKHAQAKEAVIKMSMGKEALLFEYWDDGKGFDPRDESTKAGLGLKNLRSRVSSLGGSIDFQTGTSAPYVRTRITIPIAETTTTITTTENQSP